MDIACLDSILHREIGEKTEQGEKPGCYKFNSWNVKKNIRFLFSKVNGFSYNLENEEDHQLAFKKDLASNDTM